MDTPPAEELLKKIQELEAGHAHLKQEMSKLMLSGTANQTETKSENKNQRSHSVSPQRSRLKKASSSFRHSPPLKRESRNRDGFNPRGSERGCGPAAANFTDKQYLNILESLGQSVHIFDLDGRITYWNRTAQNLYGYSASEALGQNATKLLTDARDFELANNITNRIMMGERWTGQFPVKNKAGEWFVAVATNTPFYDDDGSLVGIICVSNDSKRFQESSMSSSKSSDGEHCYGRSRSATTAKFGLIPDQPLQVAIASKISNLATKVTNKVKSRIRTGENFMQREGGSGDSQYSDHGSSEVVLTDNREDANSSGASTPRGDIHPSPCGQFSQVEPEEKSPRKPSRDNSDECEGKPAIHKIITSKAEAWISSKKGMSWPWKGNERDGSEARTTRFGWPWLNNDQENDSSHHRSTESGAKQEIQVGEFNRPANNEASGSWSSSFNVNSTSSVSSSGSTSSSAVHKVDMEIDCLDYEILWEDLTIGEQIGQGSCGTVYHGLWYGSVCYFLPCTLLATSNALTKIRKETVLQTSVPKNSSNKCSE